MAKKKTTSTTSSKTPSTGRKTEPKLHVTITVGGNKRLYAVSTDGIKCDIMKSPERDACKAGDQWTARGVKGRIIGQKGASQVALIQRQSQGFIDEVPDHWISSKNLEKLQIYLHGGEHVLTTGRPGTGKTMLITRFAAAKGWGYFIANATQMLTPRDWFGADAASAGSTKFIPSALANWLREVGTESSVITHLLGIDEINRAQGKATNGLVDLLGPLRSVTVPSIDGSVEIRLPSNVAVVATANVGREYSGTHPLDKALENRFSPMNVGNPPVDDAVRLLKAEPRFSSLSLSDIQELVVAAEVLNDQFEGRATIHSAPSFRGLQAALLLRRHGWSRDDSIDHGFLNGMDKRESDDLWAALSTKLEDMRRR